MVYIVSIVMMTAGVYGLAAVFPAVEAIYLWRSSNTKAERAFWRRTVVAALIAQLLLLEVAAASLLPAIGAGRLFWSVGASHWIFAVEAALVREVALR